MKTLIVSYCPRGERSRTKKLLDYFVSKAKDVEILDLTEDAPDLLMPDNLLAYIKRDYNGEKLTEAEKKTLEKMDRMTRQLMKSDSVVVAYPMYNFSMPAAMKAWFDSVMLKGKTWTIQGGYRGLMKGKALVIVTSGGKYENSDKEHAASLGKNCLEFMGYEVQTVFAQGMNMPGVDAEEELNKCKKELDRIAESWQG